MISDAVLSMFALFIEAPFTIAFRLLCKILHNNVCTSHHFHSMFNNGSDHLKRTPSQWCEEVAVDNREGGSIVWFELLASLAMIMCRLCLAYRPYSGTWVRNYIGVMVCNIII